MAAGDGYPDCAVLLPRTPGDPRHPIPLRGYPIVRVSLSSGLPYLFFCPAMLSLALLFILSRCAVSCPSVPLLCVVSRCGKSYPIFCFCSSVCVVCPVLSPVLYPVLSGLFSCYEFLLPSVHRVLVCLIPCLFTSCPLLVLSYRILSCFCYVLSFVMSPRCKPCLVSNLGGRVSSKPIHS